MRETEFTKTTNGENWMDLSAITDIPVKVTYLDHRPAVNCFSRIIASLPCFKDSNITERRLTELGMRNVLSLIATYINNRRAWVQGVEATTEMGLLAMRNSFASECDIVLPHNPAIHEKLYEFLAITNKVVLYEEEMPDSHLLRDVVRYELQLIENTSVSLLQNAFLNELAEMLDKHMNKNQFVVHRVVTDRNQTRVMLEEFADWRVIEWTKRQQEIIADRHESI